MMIVEGCSFLSSLPILRYNNTPVSSADSSSLALHLNVVYPRPEALCHCAAAAALVLFAMSGDDVRGGSVLGFQQRSEKVF